MTKVLVLMGAGDASFCVCGCGSRRARGGRARVTAGAVPIFGHRLQTPKPSIAAVNERLGIRRGFLLLAVHLCIAAYTAELRARRGEASAWARRGRCPCRGWCPPVCRDADAHHRRARRPRVPGAGDRSRQRGRVAVRRPDVDRTAGAVASAVRTSDSDTTSLTSPISRARCASTGSPVMSICIATRVGEPAMATASPTGRPGRASPRRARRSPCARRCTGHTSARAGNPHRTPSRSPRRCSASASSKLWPKIGTAPARDPRPGLRELVEIRARTERAVAGAREHEHLASAVHDETFEGFEQRLPHRFVQGVVPSGRSIVTHATPDCSW